MTADVSPALSKFISSLGDGLTMAQVLIRPEGQGYELRHEADRSVVPEKLRLLPVTGLRALAQFTAGGAFRPLKSAPNLPSGWRVVAADAAELELALNQLYPGAVADWFAAQHEPVPVTNYRQFTERQTGMYRITAMLDDAQAAQAVAVCCAREFCLKRRLWTVASLPADPGQAKSRIPCLEPCAILLEFMRKAMRIAQEETAPVNLSASERETIAAGLELLAKEPSPDAREAEFEAPANPRRARWLLARLKTPPARTRATDDESPRADGE